MNGIKTETEILNLYNNLPEKPYFAYENYIQCVRPKKHIKEYSHVQFNHPQIQKYIVIDLDEIAIDILDTNLKPNLLILNKNNAKGHAFFRLTDFVPITDKSRLQPQKTLKLIRHSMNNYLADMGADAAYTGQLAKNPMVGDDRYRVLSYNDQSWSFDELFDNIPEKHIKMNPYKNITINQKEFLNVHVGERNVFLFDKIRYESYKLKSKFDNSADFDEAVQDFAHKCNSSISSPLDYSEIHKISKSVCNWTWANYDFENYDPKNRGVMELDSKGHNLSIHDKQVLGAGYTNKQRKESSYKAISEAFYYLISKDIKATQKAVAERSGKGIATVKRYWKQLNR